MENSLYVIGNKTSNKSLLIKKLKNDREDIEHLSIDNKYYSTDILIKDIDLSTNHKETVSLIRDNDKNVTLICIDSQQSLADARVFLDLLNEEEDGDQDKEFTEKTIILVEDNHKDNDIKEKEEIEEFCIEYALEYIIADKDHHKLYESEKIQEQQQEQDDDQDEQEQDSYNEQRSKFGHERIIEILETNMWSQMNYKTNQRPKNTTDIIHDTNSLNPFIDQNNISSTNNNNNNSNSLESDVLMESFKKVENFFKQGQPILNNQNGDSDELEIDQLESTFKELNFLRDQLKKVPDNKRKDMAAQVAMMFAKSLGEDFGDEDDDDFDLEKEVFGFK
ncbi:hypothetical protein DLAC_01890 [Tieghemostelium lacteum]|uniref:Uncharacterized protein n=1 Tax=Tieghemostelium lacteum TaxID=361077 RepID=A0A152A6L7_TIELA|nr:hypothetical protein DLAC_01890 [Tieghemostelium lacteum]|eukprot:KYR01869.1 hypothetical protein DLAC_01890 [Tieghemostelium lacteum]